MRKKKLLTAVGAVVVIPLAAAGVWWFSLNPYDHHAPLSHSPADVSGTVTILSPDWPIASEAHGKRPKLKVRYTVGAPGLARGAKLLVSLGHVLPTQQRIYTPFSISTACDFFFGINLLAEPFVTVHAPQRLDAAGRQRAERRQAI